MFMSRLCSIAGILAVPISIVTAGSAPAYEGDELRDDCVPGWATLPGEANSVNGPIASMAVFDDGSGPALYVGGSFTTAGGINSLYIAKWDGTQWSAVGGGMDERVQSLVVYDDGSGPALYAGGWFDTAGEVAAEGLAKWDGKSWSDVGGSTSSWVHALTVYDDGSGSNPVLVAVGSFDEAGGVPAQNVAVWDGATWSALGEGLPGQVYAVTSFDDGSGSGPRIYAGRVGAVATWDGSGWTTVGNASSTVWHLAVFDDGSGPALYAAGGFSTMNLMSVGRIAKYDGSTWSALDGGMDGAVYELLAVDSGGGNPMLYAGGTFTNAGGVEANHIARWDGSTWSALDSDVNDSINALALFDDGSGGGAKLFAGGSFTLAGGAASAHFAAWDGTEWAAGFDQAIGVNATTVSLLEFDDGQGDRPALYIGGAFWAAGPGTARSTARWDGESWSPLGEGLNGVVYEMAVYDDGSGSGAALYVCGGFTTAGDASALNIAKWDGKAWTGLSTGLAGGQTRGLAVFDDGSGDGPALYASGGITSAGGVPANRIARWDGTSWSPVAGGLSSWTETLKVFDDGTGPALYAGGSFTTADGLAANRIARWDGTSWSALGDGMDNWVLTMEEFDDGLGGGPALYAAGAFLTADGLPANAIAKWDGTSWSALGSGLGGDDVMVVCLEVHDDGSGPALYVGGRFETAGGEIASNLAKWDGLEWSAVDAGVNGIVWDLRTYDDGTGPALFIGGDFISPEFGSFLVKWQGCDVRPKCSVGDLDCDGVVGVTDLLALLAAWGPCNGAACDADLTGDGFVNISDLLLLLQNWG